MKIFICYRRTLETVHAAGRIFDRLVGRFGRDSVVKDVDTIPPGVDFRQFLQRAVASSDVVLVLIGPGWAELEDARGNRRLDNPHDFVRIEIAEALRRQIRVIPVLIDDARMPDPGKLPDDIADLAYRQAAVVRRDPDFDHDMKRLIRCLSLPDPKSFDVVHHGAGQSGELRRNSLGNWLRRLPQQIVPPNRTVWVSTTCVSNQDYLEAVLAGLPPPLTHAKHPNHRTWDDNGRPDPSRLDHPVVYIPPEYALQFCEWLTEMDRRENWIRPNERYVLPTRRLWIALARAAGVKVTKYTVVGRQWHAGQLQPTEPVAPAGANPARPFEYFAYRLLGNVFEWCAPEKLKTSKTASGSRLVYPAIGGGWWSSRDWLVAEVAKGTYGAIGCSPGSFMWDGGFRVWLTSDQ